MDPRLIWCAGFFDGEGCIYTNTTMITVVVTQKFEKPLQTFVDTFQVGTVRVKYGQGLKPATPMYEWRINGKPNCYRILSSMLPYLIVKRGQAILAIEYASLVGPGHEVRKIEISQILKDLKKSGN